MKNNLLQLFALNDEEDPDIASDLIEIVEVPDTDTKPGAPPIKRMRHWLQHVHLLGNQVPVEFDLLFIDIRFMRPHEPYAPQYGLEENNPIGLIHALTFAARQDPFRKPFVWGYHSAEPEKVCSDPVAIITFGLLAALEQRGIADDILIDDTPWRWDDYGDITRHPKRAAAHFSTGIENLPKGAEQIWKDMVVRYRNKLAHCVKTKLAVIEYDDLEEAYALACGNTERGRDRLAKLTIQFSGKTTQYWERTLLLQSLFADQLGYREKSWPADKIEPLKNYLSLLRKHSPIDPPDVWAERVAAALAGKEKFFLNDIKPKDRKTCTGTLAIFCWWLNQKSRATSRSRI